MFLSDLSVDRPVLVSMALFVFIVFGVLAYFSMPLNLMPDVKIPYVVVQSVYPGAGPSEVETQVTKKIEDAIATVSLIDYIQSYSLENVSIVMVAFKIQKNVDIANQEIKDKIDAIIRDLPSDLQKPIVQKMDINAIPFMDIILSGNLDGKALYELADTKLKDRFGQIEGVAQVDLSGGNKRQIQVQLNDQTVFQNKISLAQLMQILAAQNMDMPAGNFQRGTQEYSVRLKGKFESLDEIANANIPTPTGIKKLRDLANVIDGAEDVRTRAIYFDVPKKVLDQNIVHISLTNASDANVVTISDEVRKNLPEIKEDLPAGVSLNIVRDTSDFIKSTVSDTFTNIWLGILFTGLILLIFLHDLRSTLIVALSMPISIISTFVFMQIAGFSFNMMTLIGISTSVGILVSNSVVVIENIFRHRDEGMPVRDAAKRGTAEIAIAVLASTLTNVVVFLPVATMGSLVGQFFREFAYTVTIATIFSLVTSFTVTPMLASRILTGKEKKNKFGIAFDNLFDKFEASYKKFLGTVLSSKKHSRNIIIISVILVVGSLALMPVIGLEFIPEIDQGEMSITVELPEGYNLDQTADVLEIVHQRLANHKEIEHIITNLGSSGFVNTGTNLASARIKLVDRADRKKSAKQLAEIFSIELADIPNAKIVVSAGGSAMGQGMGMEFYLQGQDNARLEQMKNQITELIKDTPGLMNLDTSSRGGRPELTIIPKRDQMSAVNATVYDLAISLRAAVEGMVSTEYHEGDNQYDIKISLADDAVDTPDKIRNLTILINGQPYLLSQLADIEVKPGASNIIHRDRAKTIVFTGEIAEDATMGDVMNAVQEKLQGFNFPSGYKIVWGGGAKMLNETVVAMLQAFLLAVLLTYMMLAAILESFLQPLFILGTVPLALIGVILSLLITHQTFNIVSMMSVVMMVGVVVNNAILLLDYANMRRKQGAAPHDALMEAGEAKLKPIIMSTLSIVIGMLPMAIGIGAAGRELRKPMGIVTIGGLLVSTFMTLVIIPAFYYMVIQKENNKKNGKNNQVPQIENQ
ncbi:MAG TPA: efflux RND transporter permease subunit [Candidatus Syntrophosphaera thermopropionivorans]|nr:efflux RND transporter permease subunit [Candidatus Syntrophosphaera thermopropionivorans]